MEDLIGYCGYNCSRCAARSEDKEIISEIRIGGFNDQSGIYSRYKSEELLTNLLLHEFTHVFASMPSNSLTPPGDRILFWLSHPAGFYGVDRVCPPNGSLGDCMPYNIIDSPTGTEGYYEIYDITSIVRDEIATENLGGRRPELSPIVQMGMGIRSKYEDAPYLFYEGTVVPVSGGGSTLNIAQVHDFNYSSSYLFRFNDVDRRPGLYWDIRYDNPRIDMGTSASFSVDRSSQDGRSLLVFASDNDYPEHFRAFGNNAYSDTSVVDTVPPFSPLNPSAVSVSDSQINLSWNASQDNVGIKSYSIYHNGSVLGTSNRTQFLVHSLYPNRTYSFSISATDFSDYESNVSIMVFNTTLEPDSYHRADGNFDNCIVIEELMPFIDFWITDSQSYPMWEMMNAVSMYTVPLSHCK